MKSPALSWSRAQPGRYDDQSLFQILSNNTIRNLRKGKGDCRKATRHDAVRNGFHGIAVLPVETPAPAWQPRAATWTSVRVQRQGWRSKIAGQISGQFSGVEMLHEMIVPRHKALFKYIAFARMLLHASLARPRIMTAATDAGDRKLSAGACTGRHAGALRRQATPRDAAIFYRGGKLVAASGQCRMTQPPPSTLLIECAAGS